MRSEKQFWLLQVEDFVSSLPSNRMSPSLAFSIILMATLLPVNTCTPSFTFANPPVRCEVAWRGFLWCGVVGCGVVWFCVM